MKFSVQQGGITKVGSVQNKNSNQQSNAISKTAISNPARGVSAAEISISAQQSQRAEDRNSIRSAEDASELAKALTGSILSREGQAIDAHGNLSAGRVLTLVDSQFLQ